MITYKDIYDTVKQDKKVIVTSHYGNTTTYYKNEFGGIMRQFNKCVPSRVLDMDNDSLIESTSVVEIAEK